MKPLCNMNSRGFTLLELVVVIALMGSLASIAVPQYSFFKKKACATVCLSNRYHIEMEERAYFLDNNKASLKIDDRWSCPCGGVYVWMTSDPDNLSYPKVGCSLHYAYLPPSQEEETLFSSDFDDMDDLTPLRGKWGTLNGNLLPLKGGEHRITFGDTNWTDYEMKVNATLSSGKGYGIYYRSDGNKKNSGYCFQYDPGYGKGAFLVREVVNGKEKKPFQRVKIPDGFPVFNQSHEIAVSVEDDHHVIKIDGETILDFYDDTYPSGSTGLRSWGKSKVSFENVTVRELD